MKRLALFGFVLTAAALWAACGSGGGSGSTPQAVTLKIKAEDIKYDTTEISVKVGQPVTIVLENAGALEHSFLVDELGVKIEHVQPGQSGSATFTPQAAGSYVFYCDIPGHREAKMVGTLTVTP